MIDHIKQYKDKLEHGMCEYMSASVSERSAEAVKHMAHAWLAVDKVQKRLYHEADMKWSEMSVDDAKAWTAHMQNQDGSVGPHWTVDQTTSVAQSTGVAFTHISEWCWWVTMNMMYSDYYDVAMQFGAGIPDFCAEMARAFLFDKDGPAPKKKLGAYYHCIVENADK